MLRPWLRRAPLRSQDFPTIQVDDIHQAFTRILNAFRPPRTLPRTGISPSAAVHPTAKIGHDVDIHPFASIGADVEIGRGSTIHSGVQIMAGSKIADEVTIFPNAVLYEDTIVGPRCVIHACVVLGAYGFGYSCVNGHHRLSAQLGHVVLESDVEIGAGTTIDRGTYGPTVIGEGTKIDDQVMIAHNCRIGRHNLLCSQVGIAGSTSTGDYVVLAGPGGRARSRADRRRGRAGRHGRSDQRRARARMVGIPATPEREQMVKQAALAKLPEMRKQLKAMQTTIDKLAAQLERTNSRSRDQVSPEDWATD